MERGKGKAGQGISFDVNTSIKKHFYNHSAKISFIPLAQLDAPLQSSLFRTFRFLQLLRELRVETRS